RRRLGATHLRHEELFAIDEASRGPDDGHRAVHAVPVRVRPAPGEVIPRRAPMPQEDYSLSTASKSGSTCGSVPLFGSAASCNPQHSATASASATSGGSGGSFSLNTDWIARCICPFPAWPWPV